MLIDLCERGLIPDLIARAGMRRLMAERLATESLDRGLAEAEQFRRRLAELRASPVAIETDKANELFDKLNSAINSNYRATVKEFDKHITMPSFLTK